MSNSPKNHTKVMTKPSRSTTSKRPAPSKMADYGGNNTGHKMKGC